MAGAEAERVEIRSAGELWSWLEANHDRSDSVWLVVWKKAHPDRHVTYDEIVETVLAWGWIDSLPRKLDADRSMLRLSPRKETSAWSARNKAFIERLERSGRLQPAGRAKVEAARANGAWVFLDDVEQGVVPEDLAAALAQSSEASIGWEALPRSLRRGLLERLKSARSEATRQKRIREAVAEAISRAGAARPPN